MAFKNGEEKKHLLAKKNQSEIFLEHSIFKKKSLKQNQTFFLFCNSFHNKKKVSRHKKKEIFILGLLSTRMNDFYVAPEIHELFEPEHRLVTPPTCSVSIEVHELFEETEEEQVTVEVQKVDWSPKKRKHEDESTLSLFGCEPDYLCSPTPPQSIDESWSEPLQPLSLSQRIRVLPRMSSVRVGL